MDRGARAAQEGGGISRPLAENEALLPVEATTAAASTGETPVRRATRVLGRGLARVAGEVLAILREHLVFLGLIAGYIAIAYAVFGQRLRLFWFAPSELAPFGTSVLVVLGFCVVRVVMGRRARALLGYGRTRAGALELRQAHGPAARAAPARVSLLVPGRAPRSRWLLGWRYARRHFLRPARFGGALLVWVALAPFMSAFVRFKRAIPTLHPYAFDAPLAELSRALHGGRFPWEWLQPLLGRPLVTLALDRVYIAWYGVVTFVTLWQAWSTRRRLRAQYVVALLLAWAVLGTGIALLWSSVGPVYYARFVPGADPFAPLLRYLAGVHAQYGLYASDLQGILWRGYVNPATAPFYEGISAMPSLHVALPVLFALVAWRTHRALFAVAAVFALLIFIGSIHLAWHYALDGYVATLGVLAIWWVAGRLVGTARS